MSGVIRKVGKIAFAPLLILPKKIRKPLLLAAAVVLTAGAALPALGVAVPGLLTAGGAAAGITGALGLTGTAIGGALTGALTYAAYGATAGAAIAAASGKNVYKGATKGATLGAAVGGIAGGFGVPLPGAPAPQTALSAGMPVAELAAAPANSLTLPSVAPVASSAGSTLGAAPVIKEAASAATPGFFNTIAGGAAISGIGQGIAGYASAKEASAAEKEKQARIAGNYKGMGDSLMKPSDLVNIDRGNPTPEQKWGSGGLNYRYMYSPESGQIIKVPA